MHGADGHGQPGTTVGRLQALAPAVGSVEVRMLPASSPATHIETDAQETVWSECARSAGTFIHALLPPVGLVEVKMLSSTSTATHSDTDGQETL